jgi:hypothetical protein
MKKKFWIIAFVFLLLLVVSACSSETADIRADRATAAAKATEVQAAALTATQAYWDQRATLTPSPTATPDCYAAGRIGECIIQKYTGGQQQAEQGPGVTPTPLGMPIGKVLTRSEWHWTYSEPGDDVAESSSVHGVYHNSSGSEPPSGALVQYGPSLELPVYEMYQAQYYYAVTTDYLWVEGRDLKTIIECPGPDSSSEECEHVTITTCTPHIWGHSEEKCHAHLYLTRIPNRNDIVGVAVEGIRVIVLEMDEENNTARIALPLTWIARTQLVCSTYNSCLR